MTQPQAAKTPPVIEILHLDDMGYGPNGTMTRRKWRAECLKFLMKGRDDFIVWQREILKKSANNVLASYNYKLIDVSSRVEKKILQSYSFSLDFSGHDFDRIVDARGFEFLIPCIFLGANFQDHAWFIKASFLGDADFQYAKFNKDARFYEAKFNRHSDFKFATFIYSASFSETAFSSHTDFSNANFISAVHFDKAIFNRVGHFEASNFRSIPCFRGVEIAATRLEFSDDTYFPRDSNTQQSVNDISFLKRLSDEHGQVDQALSFNAMELRAKRMLPDADLGFKTVTWLYEVVSDFGRSFMRPIAAYVVLIVCSLILTLPYTDYTHDLSPQDKANQALCLPKSKNDAENLLQLTQGRAAIEYALFRAGGVMDFTDTGKQNNAVNCKLFGIPIEPDGMRAWGVFKSIASLALLFLAALGLRNKYRIK